MTGIEILYLGDLRCQARHQAGVELETDAPFDNMGSGKDFSPTDLVATALATCIATTMAIVADRMKVDLSGMTLSVEKRMAADRPRRIASLAVEVRVPVDPGEKNANRLEWTARICPVHHSLHPDTEIPVTFHWGARRSGEEASAGLS